MMVDIKQIAARLNKDQKFIILTIPTGGFWFHVQYEGLHWPWRSLSRMKLIYPREPGFQDLSPLGYQVQAFLKEPAPKST